MQRDHRHSLPGLSRRGFLQGLSAAAGAGTLMGWTDLVRAQTDALRASGRACILLWMQGGPSQFETFSPKPGHANGGETRAISTSVTGVEVSENFPKLATMAHELAIIRSMTSREGNHQRASFLLHTGYLPTNSVKHPTLGAIVAQQLGRDESDLPSFVRVGQRGRGGDDGGLLGVKYDPFSLSDPQRPPQNTSPTTKQDRFRRRLALLDQVETAAATEGLKKVADDHRLLYDKTAKMILSPQMQAFDLAQESQAARDAYGSSNFGQGCLLARRLVESGVPFVEVAAGNWDTHFDNFSRSRQLAAEVDQPAAALIADLRERGLLERTLVVWMGEFGRTPRINPRAGRDHYPRAFNVFLAGGGVRGGQVIGRTDEAGADVADRPVGVPDLMQSICRSLEIDPNFENMSSIGRPIKLVDGGQPVSELFG